MPDIYDWAVCAAELKLRSGILDKIAAGWRPSAEFAVPGADGAQPSSRKHGNQSAGDSDSTSVTSTVYLNGSADWERNIATLYDFL